MAKLTASNWLLISPFPQGNKQKEVLLPSSARDSFTAVAVFLLDMHGNSIFDTLLRYYSNVLRDF